MSLSRITLLAILVTGIGLVSGCSDDDPVGPGGPPSIASVVVTPGSVTMSTVGEDVQFDAEAFSGSGSPIEAEFDWESTDTTVVSIDPSGFAIATGFGTAEVIASADGVTDRASVKVENPIAPAVTWIAAGSGNWETAANWSTGVVPGPDDVAAINAAGTYTVTMTGNVSVQGLILGSSVTGTQTLATGANTLSTQTGGLFGGADLLIIQSGTFEILDELVWSGGNIRGNSLSDMGLVRINSGAELNVIGNTVELQVETLNQGKITLLSGSSLRLLMDTRGLINESGAIVELRHNAILSVGVNTVFASEKGLVVKGDDQGEALISVAGSFTSSGVTRVEGGVLNVSGGTLEGVVDIASGAKLRQTGSTSIPNINSRGAGAFEIGGSVTFGASPNQSMKLEHLVLDSASPDALTGPARLRIDQSFTWRSGTINALGEFLTMNASRTSVETTRSKAISGTTWTVIGEVTGNSSAGLTLSDGAEILIEPQGRWVQEGGATVTQGPDNPVGFTVLGQFHKLGDGAFVVQTPFTCSGTLNLVGGSLTAQGPFSVSELGVITGGSTESTSVQTRLTLVSAPSAVLSGTLRPDLNDGDPAYMVINGNLTLASTSRIEVDVPVNGSIPVETVTFLRGGQALGGTLAINLLAPETGEWRAISTSGGGTGTFDDVEGDEPFDQVIQDEDGVLLIRL